jgi:hypothetical protein
MVARHGQVLAGREVSCVRQTELNTCRLKCNKTVRSS